MPFSGRSQSCWEGNSTNIRQKSSRGISYFPWQHGNIIWLWKLKLCRDLLLFFFNSASLELLFSHSSVSDFLRPLALKHARLPCPSLSPGVCSDSCPLSQWCYLTILSSVTFSSCPQSFLWGKTPSGSFSMSWLFTSDGQRIEASASASVLPMNIQRSLFFFFLSNFSAFSSAQLSCSVLSNCLQPHESQQARPPCPSPTPGVHSNSRPWSRWCHPAISSSVIPFSSCPQSLPASASFPMSQLFAWGGQSIGVSVSASFLPMNTQDWSPLGWTGWISLQSKGLSRVFSNTTVQKHQLFGAVV